MEITYDMLFAIEKDIEKIISSSPALGLFLRPTFDRFYSRNAMRLDILHTQLKKIQTKYIVTDEEGLPTSEQLPDGKHDWKFKDCGSGEADTKAKYYEEAQAFLTISFKVEI